AELDVPVAAGEQEGELEERRRGRFDHGLAFPRDGDRGALGQGPEQVDDRGAVLVPVPAAPVLEPRDAEAARAGRGGAPGARRGTARRDLGLGGQPDQEQSDGGNDEASQEEFHPPPSEGGFNGERGGSRSGRGSDVDSRSGSPPSAHSR